MSERDKTDEMLDTLFAAARAEAPEPSPNLTARIIADAEAEMRRRRAVPARRADIFEMIGGWLGLGGLGAATALGLALGFSPVLGLEDTIGEIYPSAAASLGSLDADYEALAGLGDV